MATYVHIVNESDLIYSLDYLPRKRFYNRKQILIVRDFNLDKSDKLKDNSWFNNLSDDEKRKLQWSRIICKMDDKPYGFGVIFRSWWRYSNSWINEEKFMGCIVGVMQKSKSGSLNVGLQLLRFVSMSLLEMLST